MSDSRAQPRKIACPACGAPTLFAASNPWRPFCGERCRLTDLGAWAAEKYRVPAKPDEDDAPRPEDDAPE